MTKIQKFLNNRIVILLIILPFLQPRGIIELSEYVGSIWQVLDFAFLILKICAFAAIAVIMIDGLRTFSLSPIFFLTAAYQGIILVSSFFNGILTYPIIANSATLVGALILTEYYIRRGDKEAFLEITEAVLEILIVLNLLSILIYPNGMYVDDRGWSDNYFFGYRNSHIFVYLLYIAVCALYQHIKHDKPGIRYYVMILLILVSSMLCGSSTTLIAIALITVAIFAMSRVRFPRWINIFGAYLVSLTFTVLIVFFKIQEKFAFIIQNILGKSLTFTGRTKIWEACLQAFSEKPVLGNGYIRFENIYEKWTVSQAHNHYIDILLIGGVVLFIVFSAIIFVLNKKLSAVRGKSLYNVFLFVWIGYFILFLMEAKRNDPCIYMVMALTYHISGLSEYRGLRVSRQANGGKKLYVCVTYYQILITMVKSLLSGERYDLYVYNNIADYQILKEKLLSTGCFENIYDIDAVRILPAAQCRNKAERLLFFRQKIRRAVRKYSPLDFSAYDEIYLYADHSTIGKYIVDRKIRYHLIEDALDFYKYFNKYYEIDPRDFTPGTFRFFLRKHFTSLSWGMSEYAVDIEVNDADGILIPKDKVVEVPRRELFDALSGEQKLLIYNTFAAGKHIDGQAGKSALLCTQPLFADKFVGTMDEQLAVFEGAVRQFAGDGYHVVLKPHPRDEADYTGIVQKYGCGYIDRTLPSEVLNFDPDVFYNAAVSITSTSINFLDFAKEKIFLGREFIEKVKNDE